MFEWVRKFTPVYEQKEILHKQFIIKKITTEQPSSEISDLALFFLAGSVILDERMLVALYARSEMAQKMILENIAPHFKDVKVVFVENEIDVINMQYVKEQSVALFNSSNSELMAVIKDLYRTTDMSVWKPKKKREISYYTVVKEQLDKQSHLVLPELQNFITEAYLEKNEPLVLIPTGWDFVEDIRRSSFLSYVTSFIPSVTLMVDDNKNEVVGLELSSAK